jgi:hypothetical protein
MIRDVIPTPSAARGRDLQLALLIAALSATPAFAQTAAEVVARHVAAIGGEAAWKALKGRHMVMEAAMPTGGTMSMEIITIFPNKLLTRTTMPLGKMESVFDGEVAWSVSELTGFVLLPEAQTQQMKKTASSVPASLSSDRKMSALGPREIDGKLYTALRVIDDDTTEHVEYYDSRSGLLTAVGKRDKDGQPDLTGLVVFSDYKKFGAVMEATTMTVRLSDGQWLVNKITHIDHGPIDTMLFVRPPEVRALLGSGPPK